MQQYIEVVATNREVQEMNNNLSRVFKSLYPNPLLSELNIIKGIIMASGVDITVNHRLGKPVAGFIVTNSNAAVNVFQSSTQNVAPSAGIILQSNANATVDILFF